MKKLMILLLALTLCTFSVFSFTACSPDETVTDSIVIAVPDGGPALGMSYLMKNFPTSIGNTKVSYLIVDGADGIKAAVAGGKADFAIMPTNMASALYNNGIDIRVLGTNSYGLLYLLSTEAASENFDYNVLKGKVLNALGQGGTPEIVLKKILESKGLEWVVSDEPVEGKVALKFHKEGKTIIGGFANNKIQYGILGEPAASTAMKKVGASLKIVSDLQQEWKSATNTTASYPQTALVAKKAVIDADPTLVKLVAQLTLDGSKALLEDASLYIKELQARGATVPETFGPEGVKRANITPKFGTEAKTDIVNYLSIIKDFTPALIGNKLPDDDFYYDVEIDG